MGITIKDAPLVEQLSGDEKIPISDGSNEPRTVNVGQIKEFANKGIEIPTKVSELENDSGYATSKEVEDAISKIPIPDVSGQIASALVDYVKKVEGKGLSTNDFTNDLKAKLETIIPNDISELEAEIGKLETALNTLVVGNASNAIESFNEIIAFLDGISDNEDLDSIIASIEQQIASKYSKPLSGIPKSDFSSDVQSSLNKAETALQEEQFKGTVVAVDTDESVDDPNIPSGSYDDTEIKKQIAGLESEVERKQENLISGQNIKTINGKSLLGEGDIEIERGDSYDDTELKNQITDLETEVSKKADEAETASKLSELGSKILPLTGVITFNFKGNGTQYSEKSFQLIAGRTYNFIAKRKVASSYAVNISIVRKEDNGNIRGFVINPDSLEGESTSPYTPNMDVEAHIIYYTGDKNTESDVYVIDSQSDFEKLIKEASYQWDSLNAQKLEGNNFVTPEGGLSKTSVNLETYIVENALLKRIKVYLGGYNNGALAIAFYKGEEIIPENLISGVPTIAASKRWIEAEVPDGCVKIGITNYVDNLEADKVEILGINKLYNEVKQITNKLKVFDPQQTLICSNYLYSNSTIENAVSRIYYLTKEDNEVIKGDSISGIIINVVDGGTLSVYLTDNVELSSRVETLVENISVTQLGIQIIKFSNPIVVGNTQTLGFKLGFKHTISNTYNPAGYIGIRYLNNDILTLSNKDFGFGLIGTKKYKEREEFPIIRGNLGSFLNRINPYYDHLFIDKINGVDVIIPSESIYSIAISKRLGFDMIELNVKATSDGHFVVMHGEGGAFGSQFEHIDGKTNIASTLINSVTLEWIKTNVRYKSIYPKYRTAPSTLEEMLYECKNCEIIPFVQRTDVKVNNVWVYSTDVANKIMGRDNYISYGGGPKRITSAPIYYFGGENTLSEILTVVEKYGNPFIYAFNNVTKFTDEELTEIVDTLHTKGCFVAFVGCYQREPLNQKLLRMGFDMSASGWNVPVFIDSNIVCADDFGQFVHNGTISDNVLSLKQGDVIYIKNQGGTPFLSVGLLQIRFTGTIRIKMGNYIDDDFTSDGNNALTLTTYYIESAPIFNIEAKSDVTITEILFKASKR
jgi:hypothetical protein